jgi:2-hydroxyglutarate dehydrogenase
LQVIHAGLYYGHASLKTTLCVKGKKMMYDLCSRHCIPHRNTKKWIIAQDDQQMAELHKVHEFASSIGVPTRFLPREEISDREPDVRAEAGVLESESTGIVDSHAFMSYLEGDFQERGGDCAFHAAVTRIEPIDSGKGGYSVYARNAQGSEDSITVETLINSAGLSACAINNMILPPARHQTPYYAKGSYYSYSASQPKASTLLYPAPVPGFAGLGTHLTLDMAGRIRFGPDLEWVDDATDLAPNPQGLPQALDMIQSYLPTVRRDAIHLDYSGIRPKIGKTAATAGDNFQDFIIREEAGFPGFVNLLAIESPGLTSSLAIAEMVEGLLYKRG